MEEKTRAELLEEIRSLRQSLKDLHHVYREAAVGLCYFDRDLRYVQINDWLAAINGLSVEEHIGRRICDVLPEIAAACVKAELLGVLETGEPVVNGTVFAETPAHPGSKRLYQHSYFANRSEDGTILGVSCIVGDITERKRDEETMLANEERYNLAVNATSDGIWDWNIFTNDEYFSPNWCQILGYSHDDPDLPHVYESWTSRIHPDDYERVMKILKDHLEVKGAYDVDYRHRHKSGEYRWQNSVGRAIFDEHDKPVRMVGRIRDITERKQTEEERFRLQERLEQAERFEGFGRLVGCIAHDYRNYLCGLLITLPDQISKLEEKDPLWGYLTLVLQATERTNNFTKEMLDSLQPGGINKQSIRMKDTIEPIVTQIQTLARDGIEILIQIDELYVVLADQHRFEQLVFNLGKNAIDAITTGETGTIIIKVERVSSDRMCFSVSDTGEGIKGNIKACIYDPFFTTKPDGIGLGLTSIFQTVKIHGWEIDVESKTGLGHGTTFNILMPFSQSPVKVTSALAEEPEHKVSSATILIVDDEEVIREGYFAVLQDEGYTVHGASSGKEGIEKFDEISPDLVIMDLGMPYINGLEATRQITSNHPEARILLASGYHNEIENPEEHGAIGSIQKPFVPADLRRKVKEILDQTKT